MTQVIGTFGGITVEAFMQENIRRVSMTGEVFTLTVRESDFVAMVQGIAASALESGVSVVDYIQRLRKITGSATYGLEED